MIFPSLVAAAGDRTDEPTAADVVSAPVPGDEAGRLDEDPGDSPARSIARGVLFVPRMILSVAFKPVEGVAWLFDRYQLQERYYQIFWNDSRTAGVFPTLHFRSGFGLDAGAKLVHRDLFGEGERLALAASTGGRYRTLIHGGIGSGRRFAGTELSLDARFEQKPDEPFYGIGNDAASETRFRDRFTRVTAEADISVAGPVRLIASGAYAQHAYEGSMTEATGFRGTTYGYGEVELRYDTRAPSHRFETAAIPSRGMLLAIYNGLALALDDNIDYRCYGFDAQVFVRLADGPRVLALRARGEGVTGKLDDVPFNELPRLGGVDSLRGYATDRFRDRIAAIGSAEYIWDLTRTISASAFVDAGRVYRALDALSLDDLHVGYGIGLQAHSRQSFLGRISLASSIDGGVFVDVAIDPIFQRDRRVDRR